jgi:Zn-dependent M28 family amino/carboxypeptidase
VLPTVTVPYRMAYDWRLQGVSRIRASVFTEHVPSTSYNVIGDLPGEDEQLGSIVFGCHYDTQIGNVGADDNASGTVAVIALARAFAAAARERTFARSMRFIAFGTEEQLSVGSRAYCLAHRRQMKQHGLMVNFDSISSALGHTEMIVAGSVQMEEWMRGRLMQNGLAVRVSRAVTPFSDHFPFTAFGVPAAWFCRPNFPGGRWQHHCVHDRPENCSLEVLCEIANAVGAVGAEVADAARLPFDGDFGPDQAPIIDRYARELYDMRSECMSAPASDGRGIGSPNPRT